MYRHRLDADTPMRLWKLRDWHYCGHKAQQEATLKQENALSIGFHDRKLQPESQSNTLRDQTTCVNTNFVAGRKNKKLSDGQRAAPKKKKSLHQVCAQRDIGRPTLSDFGIQGWSELVVPNKKEKRRKREKLTIHSKQKVLFFSCTWQNKVTLSEPRLSWQFGNWSVSIPNSILVSWQVCWRWHVRWQILVNDASWVKSPAMFFSLPKAPSINFIFWQNSPQAVPQSNWPLKWR